MPRLKSKPGKSDFASELERRIRFVIKDESLYRRALTHSSTNKKDRRGDKVNNERMEFLGDALINAITSELLYREFPDKKEGNLTLIKTGIVKRVTLNNIGKSLQLDTLIDSRCIGIHTLGNAFEALVAAVFLDFGYDRCRDFVEETFRRFSVIDNAVEGTISFKSALMEWGQKESRNIEFDLMSQERMEDNRIRFCSRVLIDGEEYGAGIGFSKREAEQAAAKQSLIKLNLALPE